MTDTKSSHQAPLRICLIDMNNGVPNQGIRCFRGLIDAFVDKVRKANPKLITSFTLVQPRNRGDLPPDDCDLYLSSGGPGSPFDGFDDAWSVGYRRFIDGLVTEYQAVGTTARSMFAVCYSYELLVVHLGVARMEERPSRKFGVMPVYPTEVGMDSPLFKDFGDRLFAFEHRNWQAVEVNEGRLKELGGALWARESRDGHSKGPGLLSFRFSPNIDGCIFHPEADRAGALAWIARPDQAEAVIETYGGLTYLRMLKTLDDPFRLARTYALMVPGWLSRRFNYLASSRGWAPIELPTYDPSTLGDFGAAPGTPDTEQVAVEVSAEGA